MTTVQTCSRSRIHTYAIDSSTAVAALNATSAVTIAGSSSQLSCGSTPETSMNPTTTTRFIAEVIAAVKTIANGITIRGKCIFRTIGSPLTTDPIAVPVASAKNWKSMMFINRNTEELGTV